MNRAVCARRWQCGILRSAFTGEHPLCAGDGVWFTMLSRGWAVGCGWGSVGFSVMRRRRAARANIDDLDRRLCTGRSIVSDWA